MAKTPKTFEGVRTAVHAMLPDDVDGYTWTQCHRVDYRDGNQTGANVSWSGHIKFTVRDERLGDVKIEAAIRGASTPAKLLRELKRALNSAARRALAQAKLHPPSGQQTLLLEHDS